MRGFTTADLTAAFHAAVEDSTEYLEALDVVRKNVAGGGCWLAGGFVYRNIARSLYGVEPPRVDFDFVVELPASDLVLPPSWERRMSRYGNPKFLRSDGMEIDFVPLGNLNSIVRRGLAATIENYLSGTPLTIQSIVYDVVRGELRGDVGMRALFEKTVGVNDREELQIASEKKGRSPEEYLGSKADSLGFRAVYAH